MKYGDLALHDLKIDPDFQKLIPPMSPDEYKGLEENLIANGCEDALVVWNGTIVDGHNRYKICHQHNIPFAVRDGAFESKDEATIYIIRRQFDRRNLDIRDRVKLVLTLEPLITEKAKERKWRGKKENDLGMHACQGAENGRTNRMLAKIAGVGSSSVQQYRTVLREGTPEIKQKLDNKEIAIRAAFNETKKLDEPLAPFSKTLYQRTGRVDSETKTMIAEAVANIRNCDRVIEYKIENIVAEIKSNTESYGRLIRNIIQTHSDKLKEIDNREQVIVELEAAASMIEEIRRGIL